MIIARQVREQLEFGTVWQDRDSVDNYDGVVRAIRSSGPTERGEFAEAVAECLTAENLLVRCGAVAVLPEVAGDIGAGRLHALLLGNLALFRGVPSVVIRQVVDLEEPVAQAIGAAAGPEDGDAIAYLREAARRLWGTSLLMRLAKIDSGWLLEHAAELVPKDFVGVLAPLSQADRRRLFAAIGPFSGTPAEWWWNQFPAEEAAEMRQWFNAL